MQIPQVVPDIPLPPCPRCGKQALVKSTHEDVYTCLNCSFRKDLNESYFDTSGFFGTIAVGIFMVAILVVSFGNFFSPSSTGIQVPGNEPQRTDQPPKNSATLPRTKKIIF
jgi:hypothetical protein